MRVFREKHINTSSYKLLRFSFIFLFVLLFSSFSPKRESLFSARIYSLFVTVFTFIFLFSFCVLKNFFHNHKNVEQESTQKYAKSNSCREIMLLMGSLT